MVRKIDAHQHFWRVERGDYHWMPDSGPLRTDYLPDDLRPLNDVAGIEGTILVQAAQTVAETQFMLDLASQPDSFILGVVGWVALDSPDAIRQLERYVQHPKLLAVRPMLQDLQDDEWILQPQVLDNLRHLPQLALRFEVLTYARQLEYAFRALEQIPDLDIVINHLSKPRYRQGIEADDWQYWMRQFAQMPRAYCKLSGMVTEVGADWTTDDFRPHADLALEAFGPERVMFGSDWPVCRLVASHAQVVTLAERLTAHLTPAQKADVWGQTAARFYGV